MRRAWYDDTGARGDLTRPAPSRSLLYILLPDVDSADLHKETNVVVTLGIEKAGQGRRRIGDTEEQRKRERVNGRCVPRVWLPPRAKCETRVPVCQRREICDERREGGGEVCETRMPIQPSSTPSGFSYARLFNIPGPRRRRKFLRQLEFFRELKLPGESLARGTPRILRPAKCTAVITASHNASG